MSRQHAIPTDVFKKAQDALLRDLASLEEATLLPPEPALKVMRPLLDVTRQHLKRQFRLEEQDGYLEVVLQRQPGQEHRVQVLEGQHVDLRRRLEKLINEARTGAAHEVSFRNSVRDWVQDVRRHAAEETCLVQEAFNLDLGAED